MQKTTRFFNGPRYGRSGQEEESPSLCAVICSERDCHARHDIRTSCGNLTLASYQKTICRETCDSEDSLPLAAAKIRGMRVPIRNKYEKLPQTRSEQRMYEIREYGTSPPCRGRNPPIYDAVRKYTSRPKGIKPRRSCRGEKEGNAKKEKMWKKRKP